MIKLRRSIFPKRVNSKQTHEVVYDLEIDEGKFILKDGSTVDLIDLPYYPSIIKERSKRLDWYKTRREAIQTVRKFFPNEKILDTTQNPQRMI